MAIAQKQVQRSSLDQFSGTPQSGDVTSGDSVNSAFEKLLYVQQNGVGYLKSTVYTGISPYTVLSDDIVVVINQAVAGALTVDLPAGTAGRFLVIKDGKGDALVNNITLNGDGAETIDLSATAVISTNYGSLSVVWNGTEWNRI